MKNKYFIYYLGKVVGYAKTYERAVAVAKLLLPNRYKVNGTYTMHIYVISNAQNDLGKFVVVANDSVLNDKIYSNMDDAIKVQSAGQRIFNKFNKNRAAFSLKVMKAEERGRVWMDINITDCSIQCSQKEDELISAFDL